MATLRDVRCEWIILRCTGLKSLLCRGYHRTCPPGSSFPVPPSRNFEGREKCELSVRRPLAAGARPIHQILDKVGFGRPAATRNTFHFARPRLLTQSKRLTG